MNDSFLDKFSDSDLHVPYFPSHSEKSSSDDIEDSSSDEDEEEAGVRRHVPVSSLSADLTAASASVSNCSAASDTASTSSNSDGWLEVACDPPNFPFNKNVV